MSIYVKDAAGNRTKVAGIGLPGPAGKSAYQYAVEGGFSGTEDEFRALVGMRSNPNLLDNWYWLDPINQKGQEEYAAQGYTIDRWNHDTNGTAISITPNGLVFSGVFDNGYHYFSQFIDTPPEQMYGKTLTGSVMAGGQLYYGTATIKEQYVDWGKEIFAESDDFMISIQKSQEGGGYSGRFRFLLDYGQGAIANHTEFQAAKLEDGPAQTLAHKEGDAWVLNDPPPDKALELLKCQRYMYVCRAFENHGTFGSGFFRNGNSMYIFIPTPTPLRETPAIVCSGNFGIFYRNVNKVISAANINFDQLASGFARLLVEDESINGNPGEACGLFSFKEESSKIILDANLM